MRAASERGEQLGLTEDEPRLLRCPRNQRQRGPGPRRRDPARHRARARGDRAPQRHHRLDVARERTSAVTGAGASHPQPPRLSAGQAGAGDTHRPRAGRGAIGGLGGSCVAVRRSACRQWFTTARAPEGSRLGGPRQQSHHCRRVRPGGSCVDVAPSGPDVWPIPRPTASPLHALVAPALPLPLAPFWPAVPDRLVLPLIVGAAQREAVLGPDDRVRPVGAGLGQDAADDRPLSRTHADVQAPAALAVRLAAQARQKRSHASAGRASLHRRRAGLSAAFPP